MADFHTIVKGIFIKTVWEHWKMLLKQHQNKIESRMKSKILTKPLRLTPDFFPELFPLFPSYSCFHSISWRSQASVLTGFHEFISLSNPAECKPGKSKELPIWILPIAWHSKQCLKHSRGSTDIYLNDKDLKQHDVNV